jgi:hypothetical protein
LQAAVHAEVFNVLRDSFDCQFECFSSPLNCRYPHFCSIFFDTDAPFGSLGCFFSFKPAFGSFQANPPFDKSFVERMAQHMFALLGATKVSPIPSRKAIPCGCNVCILLPAMVVMLSDDLCSRRLQAWVSSDLIMWTSVCGLCACCQINGVHNKLARLNACYQVTPAPLSNKNLAQERRLTGLQGRLLQNEARELPQAQTSKSF